MSFIFATKHRSAGTPTAEVVTPPPRDVATPTCYRCSDPRNCRGYTADPHAACYRQAGERDVNPR